MDNYQLKKYTTIRLILDGIEVFERIPFLDGQTPEEHEAAVLAYVTSMHDTFEVNSFTTSIRYEYELVGALEA